MNLATDLIKTYSLFIKRKKDNNNNKLSLEDFHYAEKIQELKFVETDD